MLLATKTSLVLPLGTHFFVALAIDYIIYALALLIWWAWPTKVGVVAKNFAHAYACIEYRPPYTNPGYGPGDYKPLPAFQCCMLLSERACA